MGPENIWLVSGGFLAVFIATVLYMIGGTDMGGGGQKFWRRFVASLILACSTNVIALLLNNWVWQYLFIYPALILGFSLPYGGKTTLVKGLKRFVFALGVGLACWCGLWATGFTPMGWVIMGLSTAIGLGSVVLGVMNPFNNAPLEQGLICVLLTLFIPWWPFIR